MKKWIGMISLCLFVAGTMGCAGAADYEIELINGFKVIRSSAECIYIGSSEYSYDEVLIPLFSTYENGEYVTEVGFNDRYIGAKTNKEQYYLLDTKLPSVSGPFTKEEYFSEDAERLEGITLTELDKYKKIK